MIETNALKQDTNICESEKLVTTDSSCSSIAWVRSNIFYKDTIFKIQTKASSPSLLRSLQLFPKHCNNLPKTFLHF